MQTGHGESEFDRALGLDDAEDEDNGFRGDPDADTWETITT